MIDEPLTEQTETDVEPDVNVSLEFALKRIELEHLEGKLYKELYESHNGKLTELAGRKLIAADDRIAALKREIALLSHQRALLAHQWYESKKQNHRPLSYWRGPEALKRLFPAQEPTEAN